MLEQALVQDVMDIKTLIFGMEYFQLVMFAKGRDEFKNDWMDYSIYFNRSPFTDSASAY